MWNFKVARRNYPGRAGKKKQKNYFLLVIVAFLIIGFSIGLYFLMHNSPKLKTDIPQTEPVNQKKPTSVLPSRPEEVWSYIQTLETRTIPVDGQSIALDKSLGLTEEQRKILQAMAEEKKAAEANINVSKESISSKTPDGQTSSTQVDNRASAKTTSSDSKTTQSASKAEKTQKKYGLQCGAFKNKAQADALKARLSSLGLNARVTSTEEWHRVIVGPVGDRTATIQAQTKAKSVINCVLIGM